MTISLDDFFELRKQLPIVDVRSEGEFSEGHIRGAINLPILNNQERVEVGTTYKQKGQANAIQVGFRLVGPRLEEIVEQAKTISQGKELLVHCWRGGMRSGNFCQFVGMAKVKTLQLAGGYKTYRQRAVESYQLPFKLHVLGGKTGSGKSEVLRKLQEQGEQILDLEKLANHKGSAFGGLMLGMQPTTEQFQNDLFEEILKLDISRRIWVEDESITIGKIVIPDPLWQNMRRSPLFRIDADKQVRVNRLVDEYGSADKQEFLRAMERIIKKLGGQNFKEAKEKWLQDDRHTTVEILLSYYDRTYSVGMDNHEIIIPSIISWDGVTASSCATQLIEQANAYASS